MYGGVVVQLHILFITVLCESYISAIVSSNSLWVGAGWGPESLWTVA